MNNELTISFFGQLTDLFGGNRLVTPFMNDTDELKRYLFEHYPALQQITFVITVDRKIIRSNTILQSQSEIALLPPFSGG